MVEQRALNAFVVGSSPTGGIGSVAQLAEFSAFNRAFWVASINGDAPGLLTQSAEFLTFNQDVLGSNPREAI